MLDLTAAMRSAVFLLAWFLSLVAISVPAIAQQQQYPPAADNVVVIRAPGRAVVNGIYFRKLPGRSIVLCPSAVFHLIENETRLDITVEFFPGQAATRVRHPARVLSQALGGGLFLEVTEDVPPPEEMPLSAASMSKGDNLRLFGLSSVDTNPDGTAETTISEFAAVLPNDVQIQNNEFRRTTSMNLTVAEQAPAQGALVCDNMGLPVGIALESRRGRSVSRSCVFLSEVERDCIPQLNAGFQGQQGVLGATHECMLGSIKDPLRLVASCDVLVDDLSRLRRDFGPTDALQFEKPATESMVSIPAQWLPATGRSSYSKQFRAIIPAGGPVDRTGEVVVQMRVTGRDGSSWHTVPKIIPPSGLDLNPITETVVAAVAAGTPKRIKTSTWPLPEPAEGSPDVGGVPLDGNQRLWVKYKAGAVVRTATWSDDGKIFYILGQCGRLGAFNSENGKELRSIELNAWCTDLVMSANSVLVLGNGSIFVLDPQSLAVQRTIEVPGSSVLAASVDSDDAWIVGSGKCLRVNTKDGTQTPAPLIIAERSLPADSAITGMYLINGGRSLVLADERQLHRFSVAEDGQTRWEESSIELPPSLHCAAQQGDDRFAWVCRRQNITGLPGFPQGHVFVFSGLDLSAPLLGFGYQCAFDPFTGGGLGMEKGGSSIKADLLMLRSNGQSSDIRLFNTSKINFASFSPTGRYAIVVDSDRIQRIELAEALRQQDALRDRPLSDEPTETKLVMSGQSNTIDGWNVTQIKLNQPVNSAVWLDDTTAVLLTSDSILHRFQFPECLEQSTLQLPPATGLVHCQAGLVVRATELQKLLVIDPTTLKKTSEIAITGLLDLPGAVTASPASSLIWMLQARGQQPYRRIREEPVVGNVGLACLDVRTGKEKSFLDAKSIQEMVEHQTVPSKKTPFRPTVSPLEIQVSNDGEYLFLRDSRDLLRFRVQGSSLRFDDGAYRLAAGNSGQIAISPDSRFVGMVHGSIASRQQHPTGGHFGSYIFPIDDFSKVSHEFVLEEPGGSLAIANGASKIFATQPATPVIVQTGNRTTPLTFRTPNNTTTFRISPQGGLLVIGEATQFIVSESGL